jgi:hypothetical protein
MHFHPKALKASIVIATLALSGLAAPLASADTIIDGWNKVQVPAAP